MLPRSYLYVPADNERFLEKAETSEADVIILDLEDSISASNKARARSLALDFLNKTNRKGIALRVNPIAVNDEIKLINHKKIDRIFLPKVSQPSDVMGFIESSGTSSPLTAIIESPLGMINIKEVANIPQIASLSLGELDLFTSLVVADVAHEDLKTFSRSTLIFTSHAFNKLPPISPVSSNFKDLSTFETETMKFRAMGYWGRACIHPNQVSIANKIFTADKEMLRKAEEVIKLLGDGTRGVAQASDGSMVDIAHLHWARKFIEITQ